MNPLGRDRMLCPPDCPDRTEVCHGDCERYLSARAEARAEREQIRKYEQKNKRMIVTPRGERLMKERSKK